MPRFRFSVVIAVLMMSPFCLGQVPSMNLPRTADPVAFPAEQRLIVINYCRADFDGARLSPQAFERIRPLLLQKENPKFAAFDVVSRYTVPAPDDANSSVVAKYRILGRWDNSSGWRDGSFSEDVQFDVVQREGSALISNIDPGHPRVSARAGLTYLRQQLANAQTDEERSKIQKGIDALSAAIATTGSQGAAPATKP